MSLFKSITTSSALQKPGAEVMLNPQPLPPKDSWLADAVRDVAHQPVSVVEQAAVLSPGGFLAEVQKRIEAMEQVADDFGGIERIIDGWNQRPEKSAENTEPPVGHGTDTSPGNEPPVGHNTEMTPEPSIITGIDGDDLLNADTENDIDDHMFGGAGNDTLYGGLGRDSLLGDRGTTR
jgi:hypothetical protein